MIQSSEPDAARPVLRLGTDRTADVVDVLCESFADYPVMRYVLGERDEAYEDRLHRLVHFFVTARVLRDEPMLGIAADSRLAAAAIVSFPGRSETPAGLEAIRKDVWDALGRGARARYEAFGEATAPFDVDMSHIHLNMIGVRPALQGTGLARRLLEAVHRMSQDDPQSDGVTLTTENPDNVPLYEHFGYGIVGHATVGPGLETWGMFRPDDGARRPG